MKHDTHTGSLDTSVEGDLVATHTFCNCNSCFEWKNHIGRHNFQKTIKRTPVESQFFLLRFKWLFTF